MRHVLICPESKILSFRRRKDYINSTPLFESSGPTDHPTHGELYFEVESRGRRRTHNIPSLIGMSVLSYAKLAFSELVHKHYSRFYRRSSFQVCYSKF